ncbi:MAG: hypothetical protein ABW022_14510 [Actinoplanes sp.]
MKVNDLSRRWMIAGVAGVALLGGGGAYLLTATGDDATTPQEVGALAPVTPPSSSSSSPSSSPSPSPSVSASPSPSPTASPSARKSTAAVKTTDPDEVRKEVMEARKRAEADGIELQRPVQTKGKAVAQNLVSTRMEQTATGTIRITTARADLAGQQDQALAGDEGNPVGDARCTQKIQFTRSKPARDIPTTLLCWRTSDDRSVVTMAVVPNGRPHTAASLAIIDREWARLG